MKKILFPTDFSTTSRNAFIYALKLADHLGAEVVTLHVYDLPTLSTGGMPNTIKEVYDSIELENFENYKDEIPFLRKIADENNLGHIALSNVLKHGDFVWTLNHVAKEEKVDLIVMGTEGASGLKEVFVGSMAGSVLVESNSNVLIVPKKAEFKEIKHIAFTTRFRDKDITALKDVLEIAHAFKAKVHCLYVKTGHSDVPEATISQWKENFKHDNVKFQIIENNNIKDSILVFTELEKIDILSMATYKRGFFQELFDQSLAQKLSYHVNVPILAIKVK